MKLAAGISRYILTRLHTRLIVVFLLLSIIPLAIVGYLAFDGGRRTIERNTVNHLLSTTILKEAEFDRWVAHSEHSLEELAQEPVIQEYAAVLAASEPADSEHLAARTDMREDRLEPTIEIEGGWLELFLLRASDGMVLVSTVEEREGMYWDNQPYFVEGKIRTYIQNVYYSLIPEDAAMTVGTPVNDRGGNLVAVLAGRVDLAEMSKIMAQGSGAGDSEETYLVNKFNFFVTESRFEPSRALKNTARTEGVNACLAYENGTGFYDDYRGEPVIGVYRWMPERELCILTEVDQAEAFAPIVTLRNATLGTGIAVALIVATLGVLFSRTITGPVRELVKGAEEIGRGRLGYRVETQARDELGQLADAFNDMAAKRKQAENALLESEANLKEAQAMGRIGNWEFNLESQEIRWSDQTYELYERDPALGPPAVEEEAAYYSPEQAGMLREYSRRAIEEGTEYEYDLEIKLPSGTSAHFTSRMRPLKDENGRSVGLFGTVQDITERKRTEEALRVSEQRWRSLAQNIPSFVAEIDLDGTTIWLNRVQPGFSIEDFIGKSVIDISHPGLQDILKSRFPHDIGDGFSVEYETEDLGPHREPAWYRVELVPVRIQGETESCILIIDDITGRKQADKAALESEALLRRVLERLPVGVWIADKDGTIVHGNPAGQEIWRGARYVGPEQFGEYKAWRLDTGERITPDEWAVARAISRGEESVEEELEIECFDGTHKIILNWAVPILGPNQEIEGAFAVNQDITERKQATDQIKANLAEKEVLLQEIHHRVKNNLQVISSLLTFQSDALENEEAVRAFQESKNRIHAMARVHEHLYRSENLARIDMADYIKELVSYLRQSYRAGGVIPKVEVADVTLDVDTAMPCGLLINELVSNAVKYAFPAQEEAGPDTPRGEILIALRPEGSGLSLTVSDNGVGLPADVDLETTQSLGLRLVGMLTRQLQGTLEVDRGRERGTVFTVTFPAP